MSNILIIGIRFVFTMMSLLLLLSQLIILQAGPTEAFVRCSMPRGPPGIISFVQSSSALYSSSSDAESIQKIRNMSVGDIKLELKALHQPTGDVFEKEELVQRLVEARKSSFEEQSPSSSSPVQEEKPPRTSQSGTITTPLYITSMDKQIQVLGRDQGFTFTPTDQPFATIKIQVHEKGTAQPPYTLSLLLDTACSGFVLRPEVVERYNLPSYSTPVTMTSAGGTAGDKTGLTQIASFSLLQDDEEEESSPTRFGPLPAAVQAIDALPRDLDGIIGLSFLNQFAAMEMDFRSGKVSFFQQPPPPSDRVVVAEGNMRMLGSLGICTVDVTLGRRGPVSLLVDSGAATSLLSWKGVADLGLSQGSKAVARLAGDMGAMGSDNKALRLTHRIYVSSQINLGQSKLPGLSLQGSERRLPIDIGSIPLLDNLKSQGVGGILGIDVMMRCAVVRMSFRGADQRITFLN